jgi:hypothetical protein
MLTMNSTFFRFPKTNSGPKANICQVLHLTSIGENADDYIYWLF